MSALTAGPQTPCPDRPTPGSNVAITSVSHQLMASLRVGTTPSHAVSGRFQRAWGAYGWPPVSLRPQPGGPRAHQPSAQGRLDPQPCAPASARQGAWIRDPSHNNRKTTQQHECKVDAFKTKNSATFTY